MRDRINYIEHAVKTVFSERKYQVLGAGSFLFFLTLYAFTLPATYTGGRVGMVSLQLLTPTLAGFAIVMAGLVALIVPFTAYALELGASAGTAAATGGFVSSVLPPLLCCSPFLPILFTAVGAFVPAVAGSSGVVQGLIAVYEAEILTAASLLLVYSVHRSASVVTGCTC